MKKFLKRINLDDPRYAYAVAILAGILFLIQAVSYAHSLPTILDEGAYLNKGLWYITGKYQIYQANGPWSNHMPFAFLIPGVAQGIFGPGLQTGRYFSIFLALVMMAGVWLAAKRVSNRGWAAGLVFVLALTPSLIKFYIYATSQVVAAAIFAWVIALVLDEERRDWQLNLSAVLAVVLLMTRINLAPALPAVLVYILWRDGWKKAAWATGYAALIFIGLHAFFWPGILKIWIRWIPLQQWFTQGETAETVQGLLQPGGIERHWRVDADFFSRFVGLWYGIRFNFMFMFMAVLSVFFFIARGIDLKNWKTKTAIVFGTLLLIMVVMHADASVGGSYCVFCFQAYLTFFSFLGGILFVMLFSDWEWKSWRMGSWIMPFVVLIVFTGLGFAAREFMIDTLISPLNVQVFFMTVRVPTSAGLVRAFVAVQEANALNASDTLDYLYKFSRLYGPQFIGFVAGLIVLVGAALGVWLARKRSWRWIPAEYGYYLLVMVLSITLILSPTPILSQTDSRTGCGDVLAAQDAIGQVLIEQVPEGALLFWAGYKSAAPLLYVADRVDVYPAQVNGLYGFLKGGNPEELVAYGLWGPELREVWLIEADYLVYSETNQTVDDLPENWTVVMELPPQDTCSSEAPLTLYKNILKTDS